MKTDRHLWLTKDGRYVPTGHVEAETLAYPTGSELPNDVVEKLKEQAAELKKSQPQEDKQAKPQANK